MTETKPPARVQIEWKGDRRFDAGRPGGSTLRLDGDGVTGQSPVDALVSALASCTAVDVVDILAKRRTPLSALRIDAVGTRRDSTPRRIVSVDFTYHLSGDGVERPHAERAVELAITKYCSVRDSLDPNIPVHYTVVLNGEAGSVRVAGAAPEE
jgi:putative redox protein